MENNQVKKNDEVQTLAKNYRISAHCYMDSGVSGGETGIEVRDHGCLLSSHSAQKPLRQGWTAQIRLWGETHIAGCRNIFFNPLNFTYSHFLRLSIQQLHEKEYRIIYY